MEFTELFSEIRKGNYEGHVKTSWSKRDDRLIITVPELPIAVTLEPVGNRLRLVVFKYRGCVGQEQKRWLPSTFYHPTELAEIITEWWLESNPHMGLDIPNEITTVFSNIDCTQQQQTLEFNYQGEQCV